MARIWDVEDAVVWACAPIMEALANQGRYNVVSGCGSTPSGADLTVTVAAGTVTHNGSQVAVAGNAVTLVADGSNPRWTWISVNSSGTAVITSGTAASDPTIPDYGDTVPIYLAKVTAGATVASSLTSKYDQRIMAATVTDTAATVLDTNQTTASTTLADVSGFGATVAANTTYAFRMLIGYYANATPDYKLGLTIPSGATLHAMCTYINTSGTGTISTITASGGSISANGFGTSTPGVITIAGSLIVSSTAGTLQVQHALNSGTGTNTTLAKSRIELY